jgi:hypothetical protein
MVVHVVVVARSNTKAPADRAGALIVAGRQRQAEGFIEPAVAVRLAALEKLLDPGADRGAIRRRQRLASQEMRGKCLQSSACRRVRPSGARRSCAARARGRLGHHQVRRRAGEQGGHMLAACGVAGMYRKISGLLSPMWSAKSPFGQPKSPKSTKLKTALAGEVGRQVFPHSTNGWKGPAPGGDLVRKLDVLVVECQKCGRRGRYSIGRLIERQGRDGKVIDWKDELTADCPHGRSRATLVINAGHAALICRRCCEGASGQMPDVDLGALTRSLYARRHEAVAVPFEVRIMASGPPQEHECHSNARSLRAGAPGS